jgi:hypothetical protein
MMSTMQPFGPVGPECGEFAEFLPQLGQDDPDLDPAHEAAIRAHLELCSYCRAQLARYNRLDVTLRTYVDHLASAAPSAEAVLQAAVAASTAPALPIALDRDLRREIILDEVRRHVADPALNPVDVTMPPRVSRRRAVLAVVAAVLLVALAGGLFTALAQTRQKPIGHGGQPTATTQPSNIPLAPTLTGQSILVSLSQQQLYAYDNGALAFTFTIVTGPPGLQTPLGDTHLLTKLGGGDGTNFVSPYPSDSPLWYPQVHIHYWLKFREGGSFFYDAWWRTTFGPGSIVSSDTRGPSTGTPPATWAVPGGVGMRAADAERLNEWGAIGALVSIRAEL